MTDSKNGTNARRTLVEEGTQFKGALSSNCPIEVKGRVDGDVEAPALLVSASGAVHGRIKVGELQSQGEISGEFDADVVQLSGSVKDSTVIRAKSLEVKLSSQTTKMQVTFGECQLEVGSEEAQAAAAAKVAERSKKASQRPEKGESTPPNSGPNGAS